jgi:tetratricopeptide (TPR) repeat protein
MEPESSSFWTDIKKYEDALAKDPQSYCFAPLSELYRKVGLLDDALNVAKRGCEIHPDYVGGFMALGRAYYEKGMKTESRAALENVVRGTPDNLLAQKLLSQLYVEAGEPAAAEIALRTILSLNPGDMESQVLLDSLKRASSDEGVQFFENSTDQISTATLLSEQESSEEEVLLEELEVVDDFADKRVGPKEEFFSADVMSFSVRDEEPGVAASEVFLVSEGLELSPKTIDEPSADGDAEFSFDDEEAFGIPATVEEPPPVAAEMIAHEGKDPLTTVTLAELYISQGFLKRALTIYRELLTADPDNEDLRQRLVDLKRIIDTDDANARDHALEKQRKVPEPPGISESFSFENDEDEYITQSSAGTGDAVLPTLEMWLENISRRRQ